MTDPTREIDCVAPDEPRLVSVVMSEYKASRPSQEDYEQCERIFGRLTDGAVWENLIKAEPKVLDLLYAARCIKPNDEQFCSNRVWYGALKRSLLHLVGHLRPGRCPAPEGAMQALPYTSRAYDVAYDLIYHALPDCQHDGTECVHG